MSAGFFNPIPNINQRGGVPKSGVQILDIRLHQIGIGEDPGINQFAQQDWARTG